MRFPSKFIDVGTRVLHRLSWSAIDRLVAAVAVAVSAYENLLPVLLNRHTYISRYHHSTYALQKLDSSHRDILNLHETRVRARSVNLALQQNAPVIALQGYWLHVLPQQVHCLLILPCVNAYSV